MKRNILSLSIVLLILVAFPLTLFGYQAQRTADGIKTIEIVASAPDAGGFVPDRLELLAGETVRLRITSPDVVHGFVIPELGIDVPEIYPGKPVEVIVTPKETGRLAFACTRWCGVDHWRMRGVIEVVLPQAGASGATGTIAQSPEPPLFERLGIDIDAMRHEPQAVPQTRPSASRGASLGIALPDPVTDTAWRRARPPAEVFEELRGLERAAALTDTEIWDLVALAYLRDVEPAALLRAEELYARDCAACHGETGRGDGVAGKDLPGMAKMDPAMPAGPADFTDPSGMLPASDALLQGKILRGGMGTGMPEFGSLYTDEELWAMVDYLRLFLFDR